VSRAGARPVRLLVVSHSLGGGGAERFASALLSHLDRRRFAPEAALAVARREYEVPADVPVHHLGYEGAFDLPRAVVALRRLIQERQPDLVLSNVLSTNCLTGAALVGLPKPPRWVARLGNAPGVGEPAWQAAFAALVYRRARRVVVNARGMLAPAAARYPRIAARLRALPNPTDFAALDARALEAPIRRKVPGRLQLLWVGRFVDQKRPDLAVEILAELAQRADVGLWLCGSGPLAEEVDLYAEELGLLGRYERLGFVANPFALMREAEVLLATSDHEGLPNAVIEAQGLGRPVVSTACPHGPDEIVADGETGFLYPVGDAEAGAARVLELVAPERRRALGEAARRRARALYDLAVVLPAWQDELLEAMEGA
jgi:glycosyltransferase involved in cell wall biosynthesis